MGFLDFVERRRAKKYAKDSARHKRDREEREQEEREQGQAKRQADELKAAEPGEGTDLADRPSTDLSGPSTDLRSEAARQREREAGPPAP